MPSPRIDQGTIIILDLGRNVADPEDKNEMSFFSKALECTKRIIERKIMSQAKHLVGVILLGTKKTKNSMANQCQGAFRHIELFSELQEPNWQMIRDLPDTPSKSQGDWFDALIVAADHFKNGVSGYKILNSKIILMTNFQTPANFDVNDIEKAIQGFKDENFEVDIFGPNIYEDSLKGDNIDMARRFIEATKGTNATFEFVMRYLLFHKRKAVHAVPWNVDLSIGPNVKIPVSSYVRLKDEPVVKNWMKAIKDPVTSTESATESIIRNKTHINTENQTEVQTQNIIKGYHYGQQVIPFSDCDKNMLYDSGEKCLSVYGFTNATNVKWENLNGDGLSYLFGRKGDKKAQHAVRCLVECLHELNLVGIVRKVHNKGNAPKMFALMPVIDANDYICLSLVGICYKEDIKNMTFPTTSFKKYSCTDEQVKAFKELIEAMDLMKAYDDTFDDTEAFPVAETISPSAQYMLDCIAFRAMNPDKPLPQPRDDIMSLFKVPPLIEKRSREPLENIKKLFTLNRIEVKSKVGKKNRSESDNEVINDVLLIQKNEETENHNMPKIQLPVINKNQVNRIGTIEPINDFKALSDYGKTLIDLSNEMATVIENLVYYNLDGNYSKAFDTMMFFRSECVKGDPSHYNTWLKTFRTALIDRRKHDILEMITEKKLGYILKNENSLSTIEMDDSHEDSQVYENDTLPDSTELTIRSEVNDLFDEI